MHIHYTRRILNEVLDQLRWFEEANVHPKTLIPYSKTKELRAVLTNLISAIEKGHSNAAYHLQRCLSRLVAHEYPDGVWVNAYVLGEIIGIVNVLDGMYEEKTKIFISHSSKDKDLVSEFCDRILRLGIGLSTDDIFCTSIEDMNIKNGDDIRKHIKENILSADFSFLLISDNYKKSEICLNEMGAVWATDNNVRYYLLPNTGIDKLGWLCDANQAEQLIDHIVLDKLYNELASYYDLNVKLETWSRQRMTFVDNVTKSHRDIPQKIDLRPESSIDRIYALIKSTPNLSLYEIANSLGLPRMTVNRCLQQLQASGKIATIEGIQNRRWKVVL